MFPYFILGLSLLIGLLLVGRWFATADPHLLARVLKVMGALIGGGIVIFLFLTGRLGLALILAAMLVPALMRRRLMRRMAKTARGPTPGRRSEVETEYLRMTLDHDTGIMAGTVLKGTHQGRLLLEMSLDELLDLLTECGREDPESVSVLEAFIDRTQGTEWRAAEAAGDRRAGAGGMTRDEAYRILGLEPGADAAAIREAHRRLMQQMHPDHGGSDYLAAQINRAKEILLGH